MNNESEGRRYSICLFYPYNCEFYRDFFFTWEPLRPAGSMRPADVLLLRFHYCIELRGTVGSAPVSYPGVPEFRT
jgi:hypothetical protein